MELALWMGNKLKDATVIETNLKIVEDYCKDLAVAIADMHLEVKDVQLTEARKRAVLASVQLGKQKTSSKVRMRLPWVTS